MASHPYVTPNGLEKLKLYLIGIPKALALFTFSFTRRTIITLPTLSSRTIKRNLAASLMGLLGVLTPRQARFLNPATTGDVVRRYCTANNLALHSVLLSDIDGFPPATLHFVDCKPNGKGNVFLYFHGGGYVGPLQGLELPLREARAARADLVLLEYTLAPECRYPGQLAQAVAAMRFMLHTCKREYSEIIVGGESGGGNLTLALLAHMQRPHPDIPPLPQRSGDGSSKLRAVVAISPRTRNEAVTDSYTHNAWRDSMSRRTLAFIGEQWRPLPEVWAAPDMGDAAFWNGVRAERILMLAGGDEVYRDDIAHTAKMMETASADRTVVQLVVCPGETHVQCGVDVAMGIEDGYMTQAVMSWLSGLCLR